MTRAKPKDREPISRALREDGQSVKQIAARLGVKPRTISEDLHARRVPSLRELAEARRPPSTPGRDA